MAGIVHVVERVTQPSGKVTLVFTDIEGSTRLLGELGEVEYLAALTQHREIVREAFGRFGGYEVDTQGDSFFYAFASAPGAVMAVSEAMAALEGGPISIRVGIHTGQPRLDGPNYVGLDVHEAARIMSAGHGRQVLLSQATHELVDADVRELGEHRLKDFSEPVVLFQLGAGRFPPLRTISNTNLPAPASSFVGREREVAEVVSSLRDRHVRLLTLLGPGGTGKTRLAIEAASELVGDYSAGVFWVGLAPVRDPALVVPTIAQTLGAEHGLAEHVAERELLLVLDNLEQVVAAAPELVALLRSCPRLRLLVTSRELLRVEGEVAYPVPALEVREAVALFCARAQVDASDAVNDLCRRLDNLPLAVELAAARTHVLSPAQILDRVSQRLDLFRGGRDADARQQTLRATISWSYDLLTPTERRLFARASVFAGGFGLEAGVEVCDAALDSLESLVDKSLLRHSDERFWMLETIREFASERLEESHDADEMPRRHALYFFALFEEAQRERRESRDYYGSLVRGEQDNARAALSWFEASGDSTKTGCLVDDLRPLWLVSLAEGRRVIDRVLTDTDLAEDVRGRVLETGWLVARQQGDLTSMERFAEEGLPLSERLGDRRLRAEALWALGMVAVMEEGKFEQARSVLPEVTRIGAEIGDRVLLAKAANVEAHIPLYEGDFEQAERSFRRAVRLARQAETPYVLALALAGLGHAVFELGRVDEAFELFRESVSTRLEVIMPVDDAIEGLAAVALAYGDATTATLLLGATEQVRRMSGQGNDPFESARADRTAAAARRALGENTYRALAAEGAGLELNEAVELALTVQPTGAGDSRG
jgi:predicted ATPase/class 3 adenylate cyclase